MHHSSNMHNYKRNLGNTFVLNNGNDEYVQNYPLQIIDYNDELPNPVRKTQQIISRYKRKAITCINRKYKKMAMSSNFDNNSIVVLSSSNSETTSSAENSDDSSDERSPKICKIFTLGSQPSNNQERTRIFVENPEVKEKYSNYSTVKIIDTPTNFLRKMSPEMNRATSLTSLCDSVREQSAHGSAIGGSGGSTSEQVEIKSLTDTTEEQDKQEMEITVDTNEDINTFHLMSFDLENNMTNGNDNEESKTTNLNADEVEISVPMNETVIINDNATTCTNAGPKTSNRRLDDILNSYKYSHEDLLNNTYVAGCLQMDDNDSAEFDLAEHDCTGDIDRRLHDGGRNRRSANTFKDYILNWHVANGHSYVDKDILAMIKEVEAIRKYLNKIQNRSDELHLLLNSKEQLCIQTLKFKEKMQLVGKDTKLNNSTEPNKIVYEQQEDKEKSDPLTRLIMRRSNMTPADLKEEILTANEMHDLLARYDILLPRRNNFDNFESTQAATDYEYLHTYNAFAEKVSDNTVHYNISPNGEIRLSEDNNYCGCEHKDESAIIKSQIAIKRLEIMESLLKNSSYMKCEHSLEDRMAVDCVLCLHNCFCALNQQVDEWNSYLQVTN